jgi:hypothetical protein
MPWSVGQKHQTSAQHLSGFNVNLFYDPAVAHRSLPLWFE